MHATDITPIDRYITESGIPKKDIAAALGITPIAVSNWCSGKAIPRRSHAERLGEILNVDPDILTGEAPIPLPDTYDEFRKICEENGIGMTDIMCFIKEIKERKT